MISPMRLRLAFLCDGTLPCWCVGRTSLPVSEEKAPWGSLVCTSGLCTLILCFACGALLFPTYNCSEGLESEAKRTGHCQVHVGEMETEQLSAGRGAGQGGEEAMELPEEGLSAVSSHSPPLHKPSI